MSDKSGGLGGISWTGAAVLAAFIASTQLAPHAYDALRPAEKARAQTQLDADLDINARLWEDPFAALRAYEVDRAERCERARKNSLTTFDCTRNLIPEREPRALLSRLDRDFDDNYSDTLLLIGLVPGADFVGAEESRRRIRYATLAGLMAQDYVPDNAERLNLLEFRRIAEPNNPVKVALAGTAKAGAPVDAAASAPKGPSSVAGIDLVVPYEMFTPRRLYRGGAPAGSQGARYKQVALLWVDESALPPRKFDALARMVQVMLGDAAKQLATASGEIGRPPRIAVIGPSSTDALRVALADLRCAAERRNAASGPGQRALCGADVAADLDDDALAGYKQLARAEFYNTASTAPNNMLDELHEQKLEAFVHDQFLGITGDRQLAPVKVLRTIGTDNDLMRRLVAELQLRLPADSPRRVVIVAERDSLYAQSLVAELRYRLRDDPRLRYELVYFYRGLDGVTTRESASDKPGGRPPGDASRALEWPESRDQLDYLRRLAQRLRDSQSQAGQPPIGAIGIFANDVHDKLLVLQALHDDFPDRMFFTTDMDARYAHPRTRGFTRNLVVASSLPLAFHPPISKGSEKPGTDLQAGTPPMRDVYQVATYAAARRAGCASDDCKAAEKAALDEALGAPSLYEVGRGRSVPLAGYVLDAQPPGSNVPRLTVAGVLAATLTLALYVWPASPSVRQAREIFLRPPGRVAGSDMDLTSFVFVALHTAVLAFALATLIEFAFPGRLGFVQAMLLASLAGFAALIALLPSLLAGRSGDVDAAQGQGRIDRLHAALALGFVAVWFWLAWPRVSEVGPCKSCEPVAWLEGVSAWPSHLVHLLAVAVTLLALDWAWADTRRQLRVDSRWLQLPVAEAPRLHRLTWRRLLHTWREQISVLMWRPGVGWSCDFDRLWLEYSMRGSSRARVARTLVWYLMALGVAALVFFGLSDGDMPDVPVRGEEHRKIIGATLYTILLFLPLLIVAVADATLLCVGFLRHLNAGRSYYPAPTVARFAAELGPEHADLWTRRMMGPPAERGPDASGFAVHTLLDDWIDVQVVARRSEPIARLVIGPFLVLALLVVARSRLFDNWALTTAIAAGVSFYVLCMVAITVLLKLAGERTRKLALASMQADLRWLVGSGAERAVLVEPFKRLIAAVENNQTGAFASFLDQPLLKAMLVPLGGAGGTQLFDYLLLGR